MGRDGRDDDEAEGIGATRVWARDPEGASVRSARDAAAVPPSAPARSASRRARRRGGSGRGTGAALGWRIVLWVAAFGVGWWLGGMYFG